MDPIWCCVIGLCCPPESAEQLEAFTKVLTDHLGDRAKAEKIAKALQHDLVMFTKKLQKAVDDES